MKGEPGAGRNKRCVCGQSPQSRASRTSERSTRPRGALKAQWKGAGRGGALGAGPRPRPPGRPAALRGAARARVPAVSPAAGSHPSGVTGDPGIRCSEPQACRTGRPSREHRAFPRLELMPALQTGAPERAPGGVRAPPGGGERPVLRASRVPAEGVFQRGALHQPRAGVSGDEGCFSR